MNSIPRALLALFSFLAGLNLYAEYQDWTTLIYISKPLLLTILSAYFFVATQSRSDLFRNLILAGLVFSIAGDTFLMFVENNDSAQQYFLFGLASFLITHICYLSAFLKYPMDQKGWVQKKPAVIVLFLIFLGSNLLFLWPDIPTPMRIPVAIYSTVIVLMAMSCLNLWGHIPAKVFRTLLLGGLLFVLSDNIIALNKFKSGQLSIPQARLLIMGFYLLGQYLIATSCVTLHHHHKTSK